MYLNLDSVCFLFLKLANKTIIDRLQLDYKILNNSLTKKNLL